MRILMVSTEYPPMKGGVGLGNRSSSLKAKDMSYQAGLIQFVDKIGSYITWSLIQSMAPNVWGPKIDGIPIQVKMFGKDKDYAITDSIKNSINPLEILTQFCNVDIVKQGLSWDAAIEPRPLSTKLLQLKGRGYITHKSEKLLSGDVIKTNHKKLHKTKKKAHLDPNDPYQSRFELNEEVYNDLITAFKDKFPDTYENLEKDSIESDDEIKRQISLAVDPDPIKCRGKTEEIRKNYFEKVEQCVECKSYFYHPGSYTSK